MINRYLSRWTRKVVQASCLVKSAGSTFRLESTVSQFSTFYPASSLTHWSWLITYSFPDLSAAVDVYSDWIDACDAVAKEAAGISKDAALSSYIDPSSLISNRCNVDIQNDTRIAATEHNEDGKGIDDDD